MRADNHVMEGLIALPLRDLIRLGQAYPVIQQRKELVKPPKAQCDFDEAAKEVLDVLRSSKKPQWDSNIPLTNVSREEALILQERLEKHDANRLDINSTRSQIAAIGNRSKRWAIIVGFIFIPFLGVVMAGLGSRCMSKSCSS